MLSKLKPSNSGAADAETPKTTRSRIGWTPLVCCKEGGYQIRIACQRKNGKRDLYSSAPAAVKKRPVWAPISDCEFVGDSKQCFNFTNLDNEKKSFSLEAFNPLIFSCNPFTQKCAALLVENKIKLLAKYVDLTSKAAEFCSHKDVYDENGVPADSEPVVRELVNAGGSVGELKIFQKLAKENAFKFGDKAANAGTAVVGDQEFRLSNFSKRKITDHFNVDPKKKKMTKTERTDQHYREALEDESGLEKTLVNSYVNFRYVPIDRLKVCPKLFLPVNDANVRSIMDSMEDQFDPVMAVLTVYPEDFEKYLNAEGGTREELNYEVICGQHKLLAMQNLHRQGKLDNLKGLVNRKIPCYVCKAGSAAVANHANIRSNDTANKFKNKASNEDLLFVFSGLVKSANGSEEEASDVVKRICHCRKSAPADIAALQKLISWPKDDLDNLLLVLDRFKKFQTADAAGGYGTASKMRNREAKTLTKDEFRKLGSCKPQFITENIEKVLTNQISLRKLLEEGADKNDLDKAVCSASQVAGHETINSLREKFPEKFDESVLKRYKGAEVNGKKKNDTGKMLQNYVKSVKEGRRDFKDPVVLEEIAGVFDVSGAVLDKCNVIVYNSNNRREDLEYYKYLADFAGCSTKDHLSVLIIFQDERHLQEVLLKLGDWKDKQDFKVSQVLFEKSIGGGGALQGVAQNVTFALLFGKVNLFGGHLFSLQRGPVETELVNVVSKVSSPFAKIAYISGEGVEVVRIHTVPLGDSDCEVTYYVPKKELSRFNKKYLKKVIVNEQEEKIPFSVSTRKEADVDGQEISESENTVETDGDESKDEQDCSEEVLGGKVDSEDVGDFSDMENDDKSAFKSLEKTPSTSLVKYCSPGDPGDD